MALSMGRGRGAEVDAAITEGSPSQPDKAAAQ